MSLLGGPWGQGGTWVCSWLRIAPPKMRRETQSTQRGGGEPAGMGSAQLAPATRKEMCPCSVTKACAEQAGLSQPHPALG